MNRNPDRTRRDDHAETARPRGVLVTRLDFNPLQEQVRDRLGRPAEEPISFGYTYAIARAHGRTYVLCHEGVGWDVTSQPLRLDVYLGDDAAAPSYSFKLPLASIEPYKQAEDTVDLADFIRIFGDRLDANFRLWHRCLSPEPEPVETVAVPARRYRTIRGEAADYRVTYYTTQARRDAAAQRDADHDGDRVLCEQWSPDHPQDEINRGWACDRVVEPSVAPCLHCGKRTPPTDQAARPWRHPEKGWVTNCKTCAGIERCPRCGRRCGSSTTGGLCTTCLN